MVLNFFNSFLKNLPLAKEQLIMTVMQSQFPEIEKNDMLKIVRNLPIKGIDIHNICCDACAKTRNICISLGEKDVSLDKAVMIRTEKYYKLLCENINSISSVLKFSFFDYDFEDDPPTVIITWTF